MKPQTRSATLAIAFALGILASEYLATATYILAACAVTALGLLHGERTIPLTHGRGRLSGQAMLIIVAVFLAGAFRYGTYASVSGDDVSWFVRCASAVRGRVTSEPEVKGGRITMVMNASQVRIGDVWIDCSGRVLLYQSEAAKSVKLEYGDKAQVVCRLWKPFAATNPGQFDWARYLARQQVYCCASAKKPGTVELVRHGGGNPMVRWALAAKKGFVASIFKIHPPREASVIAGMALGTYAYLPDNLYTAFQRTGTLHLLAASGTNCIILCTLAGLVLPKIQFKRKSMLMIAFLLFYVLMLGWKPSMMRAGLMASLALMALPLGRVYHRKNVFFVSALILLLVRPSDLFNIGFQLSFLAVWGLIAAAPLFEKWLSQARCLHDNLKAGFREQASRNTVEAGFREQASRNTVQTNRGHDGDVIPIEAASGHGAGGHTGPPLQRAGHSIAMALARVAKSARMCDRPVAIAKSAVLATTACTLFTAPIGAYYFNHVSLTSLPANIAMAFASYAVFADSAASALLAHVPLGGPALGFVGTRITGAALSIVESLGKPTWSDVLVPSPPVWWLMTYYAILIALASRLEVSGAGK